MVEGEEVTRGVWRFTRAGANWYGLQTDTGFVLIDTGWPGDRRAVVAGLRSIGREPADLAAVVLTHGHPDHLGSAAWLSSEHAVSIHAHPDELPRVRGERPSTRGASLLLYLAHPHAVAFMATAIRHGILSPAWVADPVAITDGLVPGLRVIPAPGHTEGHAAYCFEDRVVFTGDALVTLDVLTGARGPRLHPRPFQVDIDRARRSLAALRELDAELVLPGHGEPYRGSPAEAVELAISR
jgi:glyoxylase-like metal-dependent hydrolase (beta-lactamase superfamily II)